MKSSADNARVPCAVHLPVTVCCARYETAEPPTFWYSVMPCTAVRHNRIAMNFKSNHNQIACIQTETSNSQCQIESSSFSRDLNRLMTCICPLLQSKFPVLLSRPFLGLETKTETLAIRSRDRDLDKMNSSALESRDHGLEITTLAASVLDIGDRALA